MKELFFNRLYQSINWPLLVLSLIILITAIAICLVSHENRQAYQLLQVNQQADHDLQIQQSQLLLEYATMISLNRIEQVATTQLNMCFPKSLQLIYEK